MCFSFFSRVIGRHALSQSASRSGADWDCGCHNPMLVTVVDTLSLLTFAGLSECRFSVPAPESHRSVVSLSSSQTLYRSFPCKHKNSLTPLFLLYPKSLTTFRGPRRSWQNHIPSSRSFNFNQLSSNKKKPAHKCVPTSRKRIDLSLLRWWLHIHVTGFEIQSRNCPLRFSDCRQFRAVQKRRYFLLAYCRHCPAESRLLTLM